MKSKLKQEREVRNAFQQWNKTNHAAKDNFSKYSKRQLAKIYEQGNLEVPLDPEWESKVKLTSKKPPAQNMECFNHYINWPEVDQRTEQFLRGDICKGKTYFVNGKKFHYSLKDGYRKDTDMKSQVNEYHERKKWGLIG